MGASETALMKEEKNSKIAIKGILMIALTSKSQRTPLAALKRRKRLRKRGRSMKRKMKISTK